MSLRDVAAKLAVSHGTVRRWWLEGRFVGRMSEDPQARVVVPAEVVDFYLRYLRLPTKLELFEAGALTREFLLELSGPDGGLCEMTLDPKVVRAESRRSGDRVVEAVTVVVAA